MPVMTTPRLPVGRHARHYNTARACSRGPIRAVARSSRGRCAAVCRLPRVFLLHVLVTFGVATSDRRPGTLRLRGTSRSSRCLRCITASLRAIAIRAWVARHRPCGTRAIGLCLGRKPAAHRASAARGGRLPASPGRPPASAAGCSSAVQAAGVWLTLRSAAVIDILELAESGHLKSPLRDQRIRAAEAFRPPIEFKTQGRTAGSATRSTRAGF